MSLSRNISKLSARHFSPAYTFPCAYKVWDFDLSSAANTILKYNGLIVDAAQAIRKSMKEYDFHGGFHFSLEHMLNEQYKMVLMI